MPASNIKRKCTLIIMADGFEETEAIFILGMLRQAGMCVKTVGLTSGFVKSAHGVLVRPDSTLAGLFHEVAITSVNLVVLPGGEQNLSKLESDPRVHKLLRQVMAQRGQVATGVEGIRVLKAAALPNAESEETAHQKGMILLRLPGQSLEAFAQDLIRRTEIM